MANNFLKLMAAFFTAFAAFLLFMATVFFVMTGQTFMFAPAIVLAAIAVVCYRFAD